jgi:HEAT repeat protein
MNTNLKSRILKMAALLTLVGLLTAFKWNSSAAHHQPVVTPQSVAPEQPVVNREQEQFIDNMIGKLTNPDFTVRRCAIRALGRIGHAALKAVPALLCTLGDEDATVRQAAQIALDRIDPTVRQLVLARNNAKE